MRSGSILYPFPMFLPSLRLFLSVRLPSACLLLSLMRLFKKSESLHQSRRAAHRHGRPCCGGPAPSMLQCTITASMKVSQERCQTAAKSAVVSDASLPLGMHKTTRKRHGAQGKTSPETFTSIHVSTCYKVVIFKLLYQMKITAKTSVWSWHWSLLENFPLTCNLL